MGYLELECEEERNQPLRISSDFTHFHVIFQIFDLQTYQFQASMGYLELECEVERNLGASSPFTRLVPDLAGAPPPLAHTQPPCCFFHRPVRWFYPSHSHLMRCTPCTPRPSPAPHRQRYQFNAAMGYLRLLEEVNGRLGASHPFTRLVPDLTGRAGGRRSC